VLQASLQLSEETQEVFWQAEMLHLHGKLLLLAGRASDAEGNYRKALDLAAGQSARSLQLRASTSLARLWRDQGKRTEARDLLAPIYGCFTEGFDTPDLKEAKALLEELS
jgi:predicted ATPase